MGSSMYRTVTFEEAGKRAVRRAVMSEAVKVWREKQQAMDDLAAALRYGETVEGEQRRIAADMASNCTKLIEDLDSDLRALVDVVRGTMSESNADLWVEQMTDTYGHCGQ